MRKYIIIKKKRATEFLFCWNANSVSDVAAQMAPSSLNIYAPSVSDARAKIRRVRNLGASAKTQRRFVQVAREVTVQVGRSVCVSGSESGPTRSCFQFGHFPDEPLCNSPAGWRSGWINKVEPRGQMRRLRRRQERKTHRSRSLLCVCGRFVEGCKTTATSQTSAVIECLCES